MTYEPKAAAYLEQERAKLAAKLEAHAALEVRIVEGRAHPGDVERVLEARHLSRVLAGPRSMRGNVRPLLAVALALALFFALLICLGGCSVTLYSKEWGGAPFDDCEHDRHNPVTGCYPEEATQ